MTDTTRTPFDLDTLLQPAPRKPITPPWLRKAQRAARKLEGRCKGCRTQYLRGELSADGLCRHCADELSQFHPLNHE